MYLTFVLCVSPSWVVSILINKLLHILMTCLSWRNCNYEQFNALWYEVCYNLETMGQIWWGRGIYLILGVFQPPVSFSAWGRSQWKSVTYGSMPEFSIPATSSAKSDPNTSTENWWFSLPLLVLNFVLNSYYPMNQNNNSPSLHNKRFSNYINHLD